MSIARLMQQAAAGVPTGGGVVWTDPDLTNASYDSVSFSVAGQDTIPSSVSFKSDGTKMYVAGTANDTIYQYSLSTAWDVSTLSYDNVSFSVASQAGQPKAFFKPDGTKFYVADNGTDAVYEYVMSSAWDLSSSSYTGTSFSVNGQDATPQGLTFKPDGTKMYVVGFTNTSIFQYSLSTAWDLSTASYDSISFDFSSQETQGRIPAFNPDGTKMFFLGTANDTVYQYTLSTAWDVSSASYDSVSFSVSSQEAVPLGLAFKSDGSKMYVVGSSSDTIYQYSTD
jgi:sugar lactone lactonase YvrE